MGTTRRHKETALFQGSNRELFYVGYILLISILSSIFEFNVTYALIPLLVFMVLQIISKKSRYASVKITVLGVLILLFILT